MLKGNKGEWSDIYTLLKIISDKKLFAGDSNLNKIENIIYRFGHIEYRSKFPKTVGQNVFQLSGNCG